MHHTDCGCLRYTNEGLKKQLKAQMGPGHDDLIDGLYTSAIDECGYLSLGLLTARLEIIS
jgi:hypothetical protein